MMKALVVLIVVLLALVGVVAGFTAAAPSPSTIGVGSSGSRSSGFSHAQLESDRAMTQEMSFGDHVGHNCATGMLERSSDPSYLQALEQHTYQVDRMLARRP